MSAGDPVYLQLVDELAVRVRAPGFRYELAVRAHSPYVRALAYLKLIEDLDTRGLVDRLEEEHLSLAVLFVRVEVARRCPPAAEVRAVGLELLAELVELHRLKSAGYGTTAEPFHNFLLVADVSGEPAWVYPRRRALEKLARIESLRAQDRFLELREEHLDVISLILCAEALRRRLSAEPGLPRNGRTAAAT